jgi:parallel beta-helix repeat protein
MKISLSSGSFAAATLAALLFTGCGGDGTTGTGGGGTGGNSGGVCGAGIDTTGCSKTVAPSSDDVTAVQTALIEVDAGGTVCLCPGSYSFDQQLSLTQNNVTVKGLGTAIDDTVLDFSKDTELGSGNDAMLVTADGFTIENLWMRNTPGNGVVVRQSDKPTFRKLKVTWEDPQSATHGAYAVYPAECSNVLIEDCEVSGAADAAVYVGQGTGAIVRRNKAHDSVLGIELENTTNGEAYDNECYNNSGGMAVFLLGNLTKKTAEKSVLHDNKIHDNNHVNFGDPATVVAHVPVGTGVIVVGADDTQILGNTITGNESAGILVVSYQLMEALVMAKPDPMIQPDPERTLITGNTLTNNGTMPQTPFDMIGVPTLESVLWDGITPSGKEPDATNESKFCLGAMTPMYPTFRMFDGAHLLDPMNAMQSTDTSFYHCDLPLLPTSKP